VSINSRSNLSASTILPRSMVLFCLIIITLSSLSVAIAAETGSHYVTIVFRYDDYCTRTDTKLEKKIIADFKRHHICCTFSIIPFVEAKNYLSFEPQGVLPLSPEKIALARQAIKEGAMDPAQHGLTHQTLRTKGWHTEFATLDYATQLAKIRKGRAFLEKVLKTPITTFVPPFNAYDANTVQALAKLGFQCLSASMYGPAVASASLKFLPETCNLGNLRAAITYARKIVAYDPIICVVFHQYAFTDAQGVVEQEKINYKMPYEKFSRLLDWVTAQKDIRVRSIDQLLKAKVNLSVARFMNNKHYLELVPLKPAWWPPHYGVYVPGNTAAYLRFRNVGAAFNITRIRNIFYVVSYYLLILIIAAVATYILGALALALAGVMDKICLYFSVAMLCLLIAYVVVSSQIEYRKLEVIVALGGLGLGGWRLLARRKKSVDSPAKR
jgi:predicted deacetylase